MFSVPLNIAVGIVEARKFVADYRILQYLLPEKHHDFVGKLKQAPFLSVKQIIVIIVGLNHYFFGEAVIFVCFVADLIYGLGRWTENAGRKNARLEIT